MISNIILSYRIDYSRNYFKQSNVWVNLWLIDLSTSYVFDGINNNQLDKISDIGINSKPKESRFTDFDKTKFYPVK